MWSAARWLLTFLAVVWAVQYFGPGIEKWWSTPSASAGRVATAQVTNNCPGGATPLGPNWTSMQKEGCRPVYLVLRGTVRIRTTDNREYDATPPGIWNSDDIASMRLIDGQAYWAQCPSYTIGYQVNWDCSRKG